MACCMGVATLMLTNLPATTPVLHTVPCGHEFCLSCIQEVVRSSRQRGCPVCRSQFTASSLGEPRTGLCTGTIQLLAATPTCAFNVSLQCYTAAYACPLWLPVQRSCSSLQCCSLLLVRAQASTAS